MAGSGSEPDRARRGSPADGREHVHQTRPGTGASGGPVAAFFRRIDRAFSRTFTASAMAEDGTRELALEMLEGREASPPDEAGPENG